MTQIQFDEAQIREAAYFIWCEEGQPEGRDEAHWLKAIDALTETQPKPKAKRKPAAKTAAAKAPAKKAAAPKKPRATKTAKAKA